MGDRCTCDARDEQERDDDYREPLPESRYEADQRINAEQDAYIKELNAELE